MTMDWQRRHALQLAMQLPEGIEDARAVVRHLDELIDGFLCLNDQPASPPLRLVVPIQQGEQQ
jgi:hypothetical protein